MDPDEIRRDVQALLAESEEVLGRRLVWSGPMSNVNLASMHAFAGLRHATALLKALWSAYSDASDEASRVLARAHIEAAMLTIYVALDGWDAMVSVAGDDVVKLQKWANEPPDGHGSMLAAVRDEALEALDGEEEPHALGPKEVIRRVQDLVGEQWFVDTFYKVTYRTLSHAGAHANLRVLNSYLVPRGEVAIRIMNEPQWGQSAEPAVLTCMALHAFTVTKLETFRDTPVADELIAKYNAIAEGAREP